MALMPPNRPDYKTKLLSHLILPIGSPAQRGRPRPGTAIRRVQCSRYLRVRHEGQLEAATIGRSGENQSHRLVLKVHLGGGHRGKEIVLRHVEIVSKFKRNHYAIDLVAAGDGDLSGGDPAAVVVEGVQPVQRQRSFL